MYVYIYIYIIHIILYNITVCNKHTPLNKIRNILARFSSSTKPKFRSSSSLPFE